MHEALDVVTTHNRGQRRIKVALYTDAQAEAAAHEIEEQLADPKGQ